MGFWVGAIFTSDALFAWLEGVTGSENLDRLIKMPVHILFLAALFFFLTRLLRAARQKRLSRAFCLLLVILGFFAATFLSVLSTLEKVHAVLYFALGGALGRAERHWQLSIRSALDRGLMLYGLVYLDALLKGVLPNRVYDVSMGGIWSMILMVFLGFLFSRGCDLEESILPFRGKKKECVYEGPPPLLDLHFYARDLVYPLIVAVLLFTHTLITSFIEDEDLAGQWKIEDGSGETFSLRSDGSVRCADETGGGRVGWFHVSGGNLLDGFRLMAGPAPDRTLPACWESKLFFDKDRRFWIENDTLVFEDPRWGVWRRVPRTGEPNG